MTTKPKPGNGNKRCVFEKAKTLKDTYFVRNKKGEYLGDISFDLKWKRWVWEQEAYIIMSRECLQEVVDFMKELGGKP